MDLRPGIEAEMLDLLCGPDRTMRLAAVGVLGTLPDARGLEGLGRALADRESAIRLAAVGVLAAFSGARGFDLLCRALGDEAEEVRRAAATALVAGREPPAFMGAMLQAFGPDGSSSLRVVMAAKEFVGTGAWQRFNIERYCRDHIRDGATDPALRAAAEALLRALTDSHRLLRPAGPLGAETLLRPAHGPGDSDPDTLLRASEAPPEPAQPRPGLFRRLFVRRLGADDE